MTGAFLRRRLVHDALCLREPAFLKHLMGGRYQTCHGVAFHGSSLPGPGFNFAACLDEDLPPLDEILTMASEFFAPMAPSWGLLVEGGAGHSIEDELIHRGWGIAEDEPAYLLETLPFGSDPGPLTLRQAQTAADRVAFQTITQVAFDAPPEMADLFVPSLEYLHDPEMALWIGSRDGVDCATAMSIRVGTTAVITGVATLPPHRGQGYGSILTRHALVAARQAGCTTAALRSGPLSIPLYERLGFRYVCQHRTYSPN